MRVSDERLQAFHFRKTLLVQDLQFAVLIIMPQLNAELSSITRLQSRLDKTWNAHLNVV